MQTAGDLIKLAKERPGQLSFGSSGVGGPPHLYMELLQTMTGTKMTHIPYKGTSQAIVDVVAGRVPILMSDVAPAAPLIKAGTVRALGVSSTTRVAILPDVPPIAENGVPGFDAVAWLMLVAPAAVPPAIVDKLHADLKAIVAAPETQQEFVEFGVIPIDTPPVPALHGLREVGNRALGQGGGASRPCRIGVIDQAWPQRSSWPGSSRPSTSLSLRYSQVVDARDERGHDDLENLGRLVSVLIPPGDLGLPGRDDALEPADQAIEPDRQHHQHDDRHEHRGGIEIVGRVDDDGAEARRWW